MTLNNHQDEIKEKVIRSYEELIDIFFVFEQDNDSLTIFESFLWLSVWYQHYWQKHWQLNCIVYYQGNTAIAIAPFYMHKSASFPYLKSLYFIGQGEPETAEVSSEYLDIQIKAGYEKQIIALLEKHLLSLNFDVLIAKAILTSSHIASIALLLQGEIVKRDYCRYVVERKNWSYPKLSKNTRSRIKRTKNQLNQYDHDISWLSEQEIKNAWPVLVKFHQKRWVNKGNAGAFSSDEFNAFHLALIKQHPKSVKASAIFIDNTPIAINYYLADKSTLYFYQSGWDEENYSTLSPGLYLHYWSIEHSSTLAYDFMMGGIKDSYKAKFSNVLQPMQSFVYIKNKRKDTLNKIINKIKKYML